MTPVKESTPRRRPNKKAPKTGLSYSKPGTTPLFYQRLIGGLKCSCRLGFGCHGSCLFRRGLRKEGQDGGKHHEACRNRISHAVIARAISNPSRQNGPKDSADAVRCEENPVIHSKIFRSPVVPAG